MNEQTDAADEKRRYERFDNCDDYKAVTINVARTGLRGFISGSPSAECMNFSRTGMQFDSPAKLNSGEKVLVDISVDDIALRDIKAEVVALQQTPGGDWCHGVRFCLEDIKKDQVFRKLLLIEDRLKRYHDYG